MFGEASLVPFLMLPGIAMSSLTFGWLILDLNGQPFFAIPVFGRWWGWGWATIFFCWLQEKSIPMNSSHR
jgi:hypothetical protein